MTFPGEGIQCDAERPFRFHLFCLFKRPEVPVDSRSCQPPIIGDLLTDRRQLNHVVLDARTVGLLD